MHQLEIFSLVAILATGFLCHWAAWRTRVPAILFLLLAGIAAGPVLGWLDSDALLGSLLVPVVSIAVAVILFEGSLTLKLSELRGHGNVVRNLISIGVIVTWTSASLAAWYWLDLETGIAALFGAIVTVSGPTVVIPIIRSVRPTPSVSSILRWEAILIDPLGAILALLTFNVIVAAQVSDGALAALKVVGLIAFAGTILGIAGGYLFGMAIRQRIIPDFLRDYAALAAVLVVFAAAEAVQGEAGLLAVTVMGIALANMRGVQLDDVLSFKESLTLLLVAGLFIILAARLKLESIASIGGGALLLLVVLQVIAGPLRAFLCTIGSALNFRERLFLGWVFPRGIVAAAIAALFALRLQDNGVAGAEQLVPLVFSVILGTVLIQSLTTRPLARLLGVAAPEATGVLIVGSNPVALGYAEALRDAGITVMVADSHWASIRDARMNGIPVFYGSAVSAYADNHLDLTGIGILLAASRQPGLNELSCVRFAEEFGRDNVYTIRHREETGHAKHMISGQRRGRVVFSGEQTIEQILNRFRGGMIIRTTELTSEFGFEDYCAQHPNGMPILAIDKDDRVVFPVSDAEFEPTEGWSVTSLMPADAEREATDSQQLAKEPST